MSASKRDSSPFSGLPLTISTAKAMENQDRALSMSRRGGAVNFSALVKVSTPTTPEDQPPDRPLNKRQLEHQLRSESYLVSDTTPTSIDLHKADLPGFMRLEVTEIQTYDHNPRIFGNEKREDIRASLLAHGHTDAFVVTRRSPAEPYTLAAGSNTTLEVVQELYRETGEDRFRWVACIYQEYQDEARLLAQHLGENLNRGDMKFWEQAKGMLDLAAQIERKELDAGTRTKPMATREIAAVLTDMGLRSDRTSVQTWQFAVERLAQLGPATVLLRLGAVRDAIKPHLIQLARLAELLGLGEDLFWNDLVASALRTYAERVMALDVPELDPNALIEAVQSALCDRVSEQPEDIRAMLHGLSLNPGATLADLRAPSPNLIASGAASSWNGEHEDRTPEPEATQRPLSLGPALIRDSTGRNPPGSTARSETPARAPSPAASLAQASHTASQQSFLPPSDPNPAQEPTSPATTPADCMQDFREALSELVGTARIDDTLRYHDAMPLGFFVDLPDRAKHRRVTVAMGSVEDQVRLAKTITWWTLSVLSGQWTNGVVDHIDQTSAFYRHYSQSGDAPDPLDGLDIDAHEPTSTAFLLARVQPGVLHAVMRALRKVEALAAEVFVAHPERWALMERLQASSSPY
jgi:ParB family protein of integrating conjugative element (PFGI_1 class)